MEWTKELPDKEGFYWVKGPEVRTNGWLMIYVYWWTENFMCSFFGTGDVEDIDFFERFEDTEFYGPLVQPE